MQELFYSNKTYWIILSKFHPKITLITRRLAINNQNEPINLFHYNICNEHLNSSKGMNKFLTSSERNYFWHEYKFNKMWAKFCINVYYLTKTGKCAWNIVLILDESKFQGQDVTSVYFGFLVEIFYYVLCALCKYSSVGKPVNNECKISLTIPAFIHSNIISFLTQNVYNFPLYTY